MGLVEAWGGNAFGWFFAHLLEAPFNLYTALMNTQLWLAWVPHIQLRGKITDLDAAESLIRFIYYGASWELLFIILFAFLAVTIIGVIRNSFMWGCVRFLEGIGNTVGRLAAWFGLLMVLQQILIIFMQRVFAVSEITLGFGMSVTHDVSWWAEELKLYNALIVCLCVSYTFVQGGHVRVDLVYSVVSFRVKRIIDMLGSLVFMIPAAGLTFFYGWFFLWRTLVTPKLSASNTFKDLDQLLPKARALRWNVETIGFSPNGFNAYFLFKFLLVFFTFLVILQAIAFFYRSYLELREGPASEGRFLDKDTLGDPTAELVAKIH
ncbi:MAG: TRAP-type mannitol/chloroaromatic compound transport system permease small subunit [Gammaproteobacteria bacterium]|jgi:TRAP-type mannitol/chloroaromatic compound transport system permease small subunit